MCSEGCNKIKLSSAQWKHQSIANILYAAKLVPSKNEAKRLLMLKNVMINGKFVDQNEKIVIKV